MLVINRRFKERLNPIIKGLLLLTILTVVINGCQPEQTIRIALTKGSGSAGYLAYAEWLKKIDPHIDYIDLYKMDHGEAVDALNSCSGIVLTGGPDVHPDHYGKAHEADRCEIDLKRDTLEFKVIRSAIDLKLPILAICRGEQIFNVAKGGSLIVDIPTDYDTTVTHRCENPNDCFHDIEIAEGSLLHHITGVLSGTVNTNHHQAVDNLADGLAVSAKSKDGLIEAFEWIDTTNKPFMLAVQWHPERLDFENPLSKPIGEYFLEKVLMHNKQR